MCVSCGCNQPNDNHGDRRNITMDSIRAAAQAANTDEQTVARNIQQSLSQSGQGPMGAQSQTGYGTQGSFGAGTSGTGSYGSAPPMGAGQGYSGQPDSSLDQSGYASPGGGMAQQGQPGYGSTQGGYGSTQGDYPQGGQQQGWRSDRQQTDY